LLARSSSSSLSSSLRRRRDPMDTRTTGTLGVTILVVIVGVAAGRVGITSADAALEGCRKKGFSHETFGKSALTRLVVSVTDVRRTVFDATCLRCLLCRSAMVAGSSGSVTNAGVD